MKRSVERILTTHALTILVVAMGVAGCSRVLSTIGTDHRLDDSGASVVVGRVEALKRDGSPLGDLPGFLYGTMTLIARHEGSGDQYVIKCDVMGYRSDFYVSLPPGRYRITHWRNPAFNGDVRASFEVPSRRVVYVGTLRWTEDRMSFPRRLGAWSVHDDSDTTLPAFGQRYPVLGEQATKAEAFMLRLGP